MADEPKQIHLDRNMQAHEVDASRRKFGRLPQEALTCDLGLVLDLSAGGMRIRTSKVPKGQFKVTIHSGGGALTLDAKVAWTKKVGFKRHEVGLEFIDLAEKTQRGLTRIASMHRRQFTTDAA